MKIYTSLPFLALVFLCGCSRDEPQYQIVRTEKGAIRLDARSGEMIALNEFHVPYSIDTDGLKEDREIDPMLAVVKSFKEFQLPASKKNVTIKIQYRWMKGRMDYRVTVSPYTESLNSLIRDKDTNFVILLTDSDGFEVSRFDAPFATLVRLVGASGKPEMWQADDSIRISKDDFKRIAGINYTWHYSDGLDKALNE